MQPLATFTIISGPDRGRMFRLKPGQFTIGRGDENGISLTDESLEDQQASILHRNGRVAIYSPTEEVVQVNGETIPAGAWYWLPAASRVRIGDRTAMQFNMDTDPAADADQAQADPPAASKRTPDKPRRRKKRQTAQFITDQVGEPLVKLGEDGTLPELSLAESRVEGPRETRQKQRNPAILYVTLAISFGMSITLLVLDLETGRGHSAMEIRSARRSIRSFFGEDNQSLAPYQKHLREAQRAYSSGDGWAELNAYRQVLRLLNSEDNERSVRGMTGDRRRDEELRELIGVLLTR